MFKNTLKQILAAAAMGCLVVTASAQTGRLGGPLVVANNVSYFNNRLNLSTVLGGSWMVGSPATRFVSPITIRPFPPLPADGSKIPFASSGGAAVQSGQFVIRPFPPLPADGRKIPFATTGSFVIRPFPPLPADGRKIPFAATVIRSK